MTEQLKTIKGEGKLNSAMNKIKETSSDMMRDMMRARNAGDMRKILSTETALVHLPSLMTELAMSSGILSMMNGQLNGAIDPRYRVTEQDLYDLIEKRGLASDALDGVLNINNLKTNVVEAANILAQRMGPQTVQMLSRMVNHNLAHFLEGVNQQALGGLVSGRL